LAIGVLAQAAFLAGDARATKLHAPWLGDVYRRTLGWRALGLETGRLARQVGARAIVGDQRDDVASLLYYWRDQPEPVFAWPSGATPSHQFELTRAISDTTPLPILFVSRCPFEKRVSAHFTTVQALGTFAARMGPTSARTYHAFKADAPRGPIGPLAPCS
jgi:hypothetical protein